MLCTKVESAKFYMDNDMVICTPLWCYTHWSKIIIKNKQVNGHDGIKTLYYFLFLFFLYPWFGFCYKMYHWQF